MPMPSHTTFSATDGMAPFQPLFMMKPIAPKMFST